MTTRRRTDRTAIDILTSITPDIPEVPLEPGIVKMVGILNSKGLATAMSCEGHGPRSQTAWIELRPANFKDYMNGEAKKMEQFLLVGDGRWYLDLCYFGESQYPGLGRIPRKPKLLRRVVTIEMRPRICLRTRAREGTSSKSRKTRWMLAMEAAASKYL